MFGRWSVIGDSDFWKCKWCGWHQFQGKIDPFNAFGLPRESLNRKIKKTNNQFNRASASHFHYPKTKADLKSAQQEMRILKMTKRCGDRRVIVCSRSALNHTLFNFSLYQGERMSKRTDWTIELTNETNERNVHTNIILYKYCSEVLVVYNIFIVTTVLKFTRK